MSGEVNNQMYENDQEDDDPLMYISSSAPASTFTSPKLTRNPQSYNPTKNATLAIDMKTTSNKNQRESDGQMHHDVMASSFQSVGSDIEDGDDDHLHDSNSYLFKSFSANGKQKNKSRQVSYSHGEVEYSKKMRFLLEQREKKRLQKEQQKNNIKRLYYLETGRSHHGNHFHHEQQRDQNRQKLRKYSSGDRRILKRRSVRYPEFSPTALRRVFSAGELRHYSGEGFPPTTEYKIEKEKEKQPNPGKHAVVTTIGTGLKEVKSEGNNNADPTMVGSYEKSANYQLYNPLDKARKINKNDVIDFGKGDKTKRRRGSNSAPNQVLLKNNETFLRHRYAKRKRQPSAQELYQDIDGDYLFGWNPTAPTTKPVESANFENFFIPSRQKAEEQKLYYKLTNKASSASGRGDLTLNFCGARQKTVFRWLLTLMIGLFTAIAAIVIVVATDSLQTFKFDNLADRLIKSEKEGHLMSGGTFLILLIFNVALVWIAASVTVYGAPRARGSGISEIKCELNGMKIPNAVRIQTMFTKIIGIVCGVAGGMPVGKEGPMIHCGAIMGAGLSQGKSTTFGFDTKFTKFTYFRNDKEKRDFIACGAAAGVAAAFGAPIGGLLFCLEEGASWWFPRLTWRVTLCAMISTFAINVFLSSGIASWIDNSAIDRGQSKGDGNHTGNDLPIFAGQLDSPGMFYFGDFTQQSRAGYYAWEVIIFVLMGIGGGLFGALWNRLNLQLASWRRKQIVSPYAKILELVLLGSLVFSCSFCLPLLYEQTIGCRMLPANASSANSTETSVRLIQFFCPDGQYNELASLTFQPAERAIKTLFHFRTAPANANQSHHNHSNIPNRSFSQPLASFRTLMTTMSSSSPSSLSTADQFESFSFAALAIFFGVYFILSCLTYGTYIPSGLFVPILLCGGAYGRFIGSMVQIFFASVDNQNSKQDTGYHSPFTPSDPGTYALIGAVSLLGGITRIIVSLTVIIIECTGNVQIGLPLMLTLFAARWVGNRFNEGIYDEYIADAGLPFLEWEPPKFFHHLKAEDVMKANVICFRDRERADYLLHILQTTTHNAFPVVRTRRQKPNPSKDNSNSGPLASDADGDLDAFFRFRKETLVNRGMYPMDDRVSEGAENGKKFNEDSMNLQGAGELVGIVLRSHLSVLLDKLAKSVDSRSTSTGDKKHLRSVNSSAPSSPPCSTSPVASSPIFLSSSRESSRTHRTSSVDEEHLIAINMGEEKMKYLADSITYLESPQKIGTQDSASASLSSSSPLFNRDHASYRYGTNAESSPLIKGGVDGRGKTASIVGMTQPLEVRWKEIESQYPRFQNVDNINLSSLAKTQWLDLRIGATEFPSWSSAVTAYDDRSQSKPEENRSDNDPGTKENDTESMKEAIPKKTNEQDQAFDSHNNTDGHNTMEETKDTFPSKYLIFDHEHSYSSVVLDRYPKRDFTGISLDENLAGFCFPAAIKPLFWPPRDSYTSDLEYSNRRIRYQEAHRARFKRHKSVRSMHHQRKSFYNSKRGSDSGSLHQPPGAMINKNTSSSTGTNNNQNDTNEDTPPREESGSKKTDSGGDKLVSKRNPATTTNHSYLMGYNEMKNTTLSRRMTMDSAYIGADTMDLDPTDTDSILGGISQYNLVSDNEGDLDQDSEEGRYFDFDEETSSDAHLNFENDELETFYWEMGGSSSSNCPVYPCFRYRASQREGKYTFSRATTVRRRKSSSSFPHSSYSAGSTSGGGGPSLEGDSSSHNNTRKRSPGLENPKTNHNIYKSSKDLLESQSGAAADGGNVVYDYGGFLNALQPMFHLFVLTLGDGTRSYGACLQVWERLHYRLCLPKDILEGDLGLNCTGNPSCVDPNSSTPFSSTFSSFFGFGTTQQDPNSVGSRSKDEKKINSFGKKMVEQSTSSFLSFSDNDVSSKNKSYKKIIPINVPSLRTMLSDPDEDEFFHREFVGWLNRIGDDPACKMERVESVFAQKAREIRLYRQMIASALQSRNDSSTTGGGSDSGSLSSSGRKKQRPGFFTKMFGGSVLRSATGGRQHGKKGGVGSNSEQRDKVLKKDYYPNVLLSTWDFCFGVERLFQECKNFQMALNLEEEKETTTNTKTKNRTETETDGFAEGRTRQDNLHQEEGNETIHGDGKSSTDHISSSWSFYSNPKSVLSAKLHQIWERAAELWAHHLAIDSERPLFTIVLKEGKNDNNVHSKDSPEPSLRNPYVETPSLENLQSMLGIWIQYRQYRNFRRQREEELIINKERKEELERLEKEENSERVEKEENSERLEEKEEDDDENENDTTGSGEISTRTRETRVPSVISPDTYRELVPPPMKLPPVFALMKLLETISKKFQQKVLLPLYLAFVRSFAFDIHGTKRQCWVPKALVLTSRQPYFRVMEAFLRQVWKLLNYSGSGYPSARLTDEQLLLLSNFNNVTLPYSPSSVSPYTKFKLLPFLEQSMDRTEDREETTSDHKGKKKEREKKRGKKKDKKQDGINIKTQPSSKSDTKSSYASTTSDTTADTTTDTTESEERHRGRKRRNQNKIRSRTSQRSSKSESPPPKKNISVSKSTSGHQSSSTKTQIQQGRQLRQENQSSDLTYLSSKLEYQIENALVRQESLWLHNCSNIHQRNQSEGGLLSSSSFSSSKHRKHHHNRQSASSNMTFREDDLKESIRNLAIQHWNKQYFDDSNENQNTNESHSSLFTSKKRRSKIQNAAAVRARMEAEENHTPTVLTRFPIEFIIGHFLFACTIPPPGKIRLHYVMAPTRFLPHETLRQYHSALESNKSSGISSSNTNNVKNSGSEPGGGTFSRDGKKSVKRNDPTTYQDTYSGSKSFASKVGIDMDPNPQLIIKEGGFLDSTSIEKTQKKLSDTISISTGGTGMRRQPQQLHGLSAQHGPEGRHSGGRGGGVSSMSKRGQTAASAQAAQTHEVSGTTISFYRPPLNRLPMCNLSLAPLFVCLGVQNVLQVLAALLCEQKVVLISSYTGLLGISAESLRVLLFPLSWVGPFIPVLTENMLDILYAPLPLLVGCQRSIIRKRVLSEPSILDRVVVVDLDFGRVITRTCDWYSVLESSRKGFDAALRDMINQERERVQYAGAASDNNHDHNDNASDSDGSNSEKELDAKRRQREKERENEI
eukprot:g2345.t1